MQPIREREGRIPTRFGPVRAKWYLPDRTIERAALLVPGVNALAIDEPRLIHIARTLAASGVAVITPEVADLKGYRVTPACTDTIEDAAKWLADQRDLTGGRRIGIIGISFAGGLAVSAASRPSIRDRLAYVFSFGGHADFQRVLRFLCTGQETTITADEVRAGTVPKGARPTHYRAPHDYGVAVVAYDAAHLVAPPDQVKPLEAAVLTFLEGSHLALYDQAGAQREFARARVMEAALPEPSRTVAHLVNTRNVVELGKLLWAHIPALGDEPALSPGKAPAPSAPVFLIHGAEDNVVPPSETLLLVEHLRGRTKVQWLLSSLISHASLDKQASTRDVWELVRFWAAILKA